MSVRNQRIRFINVLSTRDKIIKHAKEADAGWGKAYDFYSKVIEKYQLKTIVELGVAFGGHAESILKNTSIHKLYGIDPYEHMPDYEDPMNLPQEEFEELYNFTLKRLSSFGDRYVHIRKFSKDAVDIIPATIDSIYIDADHSYAGVWNDLCTWFPKVRVGGIIAGHDYGHPNFPGVKQAINEFFQRFDWEIHDEGEGVWWVEKKSISVSFIIPAYNCSSTISETVASIIEGNFETGDEIIVVNDGSSDDTNAVLNNLKKTYSIITVLNHTHNKGGGAARNTATEHATNPILFCLDSDNILKSSSIPQLKAFMLNNGSDIAAFQQLHYFSENKNEITHKWIFREGQTTLADYLSGAIVPGASGNYMFTKNSWKSSKGYPEFAGALDAWGFGLRQVATGHKMMVMPSSHYYHRCGHESYWVRESKKGITSLTALQILIPFLDQIAEDDIDYIMSRKGRHSWFDALDRRPICIRPHIIGKAGIAIDNFGNPIKNVTSYHKISFIKTIINYFIKVTT